jgi:hypothetical protein
VALYQSFSDLMGTCCIDYIFLLLVFIIQGAAYDLLAACDLFAAADFFAAAAAAGKLAIFVRVF